jgi:hypothetical protein
MMRRAAALLLLLTAAGACRERSRPDPSIRLAISHDPGEASEEAPEAGKGPPVPTSLVVPPEVERAWSGIRLAWKDSTAGKEGLLDVPLGQTAKLPGSEVSVRADVFLPSFTMDAQRITSSGIEPGNPAARITVTEKGSEVYAGWVFERFPDVHPFTHPRFSLRLVGGVRRT